MIGVVMLFTLVRGMNALALGDKLSPSDSENTWDAPASA